MVTIMILLICVISLVLTGYANSEMDTIQFHPDKAFSQSDFWLSKGEYVPQNRTWFLKNIGSMFSDGWHLMKFIRVFSMSISFTFLLMLYFSIPITWYWTLLINFAPYTLIGSVFEVGYGFDEKKWINSNKGLLIVIAVAILCVIAVLVEVLHIF